jgi:hypothetical protein
MKSLRPETKTSGSLETHVPAGIGREDRCSDVRTAPIDMQAGGKPHDLLDRAVIGSVRVLVGSEVGGVQAAAFAERHARNSAERAIWAALHALELQTRVAIHERLGDAAARFTTTVRVANIVGQANGAAVTLLPHRFQMRSLVLATKLFIPHFRKLAQHFADGPRAAFFHYVLAHELAIAELGRRVLTHDNHPLAPVEALLGNVPT